VPGGILPTLILDPEIRHGFGPRPRRLDLLYRERVGFSAFALRSISFAASSSEGFKCWGYHAGQLSSMFATILAGAFLVADSCRTPFSTRRVVHSCLLRFLALALEERSVMRSYDFFGAERLPRLKATSLRRAARFSR
jgi:hypothetical protein